MQLGAGIELHRKIGEPVKAGEKLFTLHTDTPERFDRALESLNSGWPITSEEPQTRGSVIIDRIGG